VTSRRARLSLPQRSTRMELASSAMMKSKRVEDDRWDARPDPLLLRAVRPLVRALSLVHPVKLDGEENVPRGAALLVGNHGMLGYESPLFFERMLSAFGRLPIGLADRWFFRVPGVRDLLVRLGGTYGSAANGMRALGRGDLVVCYPGGAREVFKTEADKYRCLWDKSVGFVRLAIEARVPIIPFAAAGVDDTYRVVTRLRGSGTMLMGHRKYDLPIVWGLGPLPRPVPFWFRFGEPILPPANVVSTDDDAVHEIHANVWSRTQAMIDDLVTAWEKAA
jgi:1-acyl-sn-glycerol-3-phosphate acyltransferase